MFIFKVFFLKLKCVSLTSCFKKFCHLGNTEYEEKCFGEISFSAVFRRVKRVGGEPGGRTVRRDEAKKGKMELLRKGRIDQLQ